MTTEGKNPLTRRKFLAAGAATFASSSVLGSALAGPAGASSGPASGTVTANGLQFHYTAVGQGPLALCLHGFPDSPYSYRYLLPTLAAVGYRAVGVYMRGYAPTAVPSTPSYHTSDLAADVAALHDALGGDEDAVLIAHDWGAVAAYGGAQLEPARWRRCVIMNIPPLAVYGQVAFAYPQIKRSFYQFFFTQTIADAIVPMNDHAFIDSLWADWSPGYNATQDLIRAKACLSDPANLNAALGYYRSFFDPATFGTPAAMAEQAAVWGQPLTQRTLYLHGKRDGCIALDAAAVSGIPSYLGPGSQAVLVDNAGHFLLVEKPIEVNTRILQFLSAA